MKPPSATDTSTLPLRESRVVARTPFYYGWVVLLAATFGMLMTTPGQTLGVSVFLDRIIADLGLSRATVSLLYTVGTLVGSFSLLHYALQRTLRPVIRLFRTHPLRRASTIGACRPL